jgi:hypothetical protein
MQVDSQPVDWLFFGATRAPAYAAGMETRMLTIQNHPGGVSIRLLAIPARVSDPPRTSAWGTGAEQPIHDAGGDEAHDHRQNAPDDLVHGAPSIISSDPMKRGRRF